MGEECKSDLDGQFGEDTCVFIQCDVTDAGKLRGKTFVCTYPFSKDMYNIFSSLAQFEKYVLERNNYPLYCSPLGLCTAHLIPKQYRIVWK